jgi:hypothetical protein
MVRTGLANMFVCSFVSLNQAIHGDHMSSP